MKPNLIKYYQCAECEFVYKNTDAAQKCEKWCREHKSCNLEIIKNAVKTETATFAAGCFWGVEDKFMKTRGVIETTVGYSGGHTENPTYEEVCYDKTGHAESVQVTFNPDIISYSELLDIFWSVHDPTWPDRQGAHIGSQYRSIIFYHSDEQKELAQNSKKELGVSGKYENPIITEIIPAQKFFKAEEYHQKYLKKHGASAC